jgi:predicted AAA+ superfamily ATPase
VQNNLAALERLFLIRTLPAWHASEARRLIKAPKVHLVDSGLAATLAGLEAEEWTTRRERFGHAVESFAVQQIVAQAAWTDPDLRFWHYRDKDQVEVDLVITRGRNTWGVEVKAGATVTPSDGRGLLRLAERCGKDFRAGVILHAGVSTLPMADRRLLAVPLAALWEL